MTSTDLKHTSLGGELMVSGPPWHACTCIYVGCGVLGLGFLSSLPLRLVCYTHVHVANTVSI